MKAGLLPELYGGGMVGAGSRWRVAVVRPGNAPINTLANVLNKHDVLGNELGEYSTSKQFSILFTETMLRRGRLGLIEAVEYAELPTDVNLLVVIDQFEEIFRYKVTHKDTNAADESAAFVKLLLEAIKRKQPPIYILLTMRSDYLGECYQFEGLAEEINKSHYLVPRMTRDQLREAILSPIAVASARVGGANITTQLLNRLLNDVGDNPDQLPILQHALMRTWNNWMQDESTSHDKFIDLKHYINIGSMREALSQHGDEIYNELSLHQKQIAETLFKCLTLKEDGKYIRRPTKLERICDIAKVSEEDVIQIVDQFRSEGRSFLTPYTGEINFKDVIDISHESLIRLWKKLQKWSDEEADKAEDYHRLVEDWKLKERKKGGLLNIRRLEVALDWCEKYNPDEAWAAMYADKSGDATDFKAVMQFLKDSKIEDEKKKAEEKRQQHIKIRLAFGLTAVVTLACIFLFFLWRETKKGQLNALSSSSEAYFASDQQPDALIESLKAGRELKQWYSQAIDSKTKSQVLAVLREMVYKVNERNILKKHTGWVTCLSFSKDGKLLASGSEDKTIKLWERDGRFFNEMDNKSLVKSLAFSPDGEVLVSGDDEKTIKLWSIHKTHPIMELPKQEDSVTSVDFSPDGKRFVSASGRRITLWERNGRLIKIFPNLHTALVNSVKFLDNNTIASGSDDKTIKNWRIDGKEIATWEDTNKIADISFNPKLQLIASASGDQIKLWSRRDGKQQGKPLEGHNSTILTLNLSHDGQSLASADLDGRVIIWNWNTKTLTFEPIENIRGHHDDVSSVRFSPDDKTLASASYDQTVKFWSRDGKEALTILDKHTDTVNEVSFSPDGQKIASASTDNTVKLWSRDGKELKTLNGHSNPVYSVKFSPDGQRIASASEDKTVRLWDSEGNLLKTLDKHTDAVRHVSFSPDGNILASASDDGKIILWNRDGNLLKTLEGNDGAVVRVSFSLDGQRIVSAHEKTIKIWNREGIFQKSLPVTGSIRSINVSPDGAIIASFDSGEPIRLWNKDGINLSSPAIEDKDVWDLSFNHDGQMIASVGSDDNTTKLWDRNGKLINSFEGHTSTAYSVVFSPDNKLLASAGSDKKVIIWYLSLDDLLVKGCNKIHDYLIQTDIEQYSYLCNK
ncbi:MAG: hypothetical protein RM368_15510 [Nostoc sp. DedSLP03]|nr:hypothetical protein [Nostoc sp. DedSLP03]MDZ7966360.1 hypothetical protein [Nostoc sp. DedSLP03]